MNAHSLVTRTSLDSWSADALARPLRAALEHDGALMLTGMADEQVYALLPELRRELDTHDVALLTLDPTGALSPHQTFASVIDALVREVERRGAMTAHVEELFDGLHQLRLGEQAVSWAPGKTSRERLVMDTLGQLWVALCEIVACAVVIFRPGMCRPQVAAQLEHINRYYLHDPLDALAPEHTGWRAARGVMLAIVPDGQPPACWAEPAPRALDATAHIEHSVREYLGREDVLRRLVETTRGDLERLDALVEDWSSQLDHVRMPRFARLDALSQQVLTTLALAAEAVEMGLLARALGPGTSPAPALRALLKEGWLQRAMQTGQARLALADATLGEAIVGRLDAEARRERHAAIAHAAAADPEPARHAVLITRHALAAGEDALVVRFGMSAARRLFAEGALEDAAALLGAMLDRPDALSAAERAEAHATLVELHAQLAHWRLALRHCGLLKRHVAGARGEAELRCRIASLLLRLNRHETVITLMDQLVAAHSARHDGMDDLIARAIVLAGEACFSLGQHHEARAHAEDAIARLEALERDGRMLATDAERLRVTARNLLGKVSIFTAEHDAACALFQENLESAELFGWADDLARAEGNLGIVAMQRGDYDRAQAHLARVTAIPNTSEPQLRALAALNLAIIHQYRGDHGDALACYLDAMRAARQMSADSIYANAAYNLLTLYRDLGAFERAARLLDHLKDDHQPQRHTFMARWASFIEANLLREQGRLDEALALLRADREDDEAQRDIISGTPLRRTREAEVLVSLGRADEARALLDATPPHEARDEQPVVALHHVVRARLALLDGDAEAAERALRAALVIWQSLQDRREQTHATLWLARALERLGRADEARRELRALGEAVVAHAARVPATLRAGFLSMPLHRELADQLHRHDLPLPEALRPSVATGAVAPTLTELAPTRDAQWLAWRARYASIVGESPRLHQIFRMLDRVADSETTVLVHGESGTGKELVAEAIHQHSARASGPFIKVNCAAFVESLLLSELFGHEKGAFTGAVSQKIGRFEMADGGTIFLDEIADISMHTQVALLRVLQEREFERVGGTTTRKVDVRIVCATNKPLEDLVARGEFRLDLYYRLKGVVVELPALRERREDIPLLVRAFTERFAQDPEAPPTLSREAMRALMAYSWPGNIRELQNFVRSVLLFVEDGEVQLEHVEEFGDFFAHGQTLTSAEALAELDALLDADAAARQPDAQMSPSPNLTDAPEHDTPASASPALVVVNAEPAGDPEDLLVEQIISQGLSLTNFKKRLEYECIRRALIETQGNVTQAAEILQMKRPRLSQIINADPELADLKAQLVR